MGQMGKWAWQCTTTGLDNSIELRTEKIHQAVTEIWAPQVWQPPARPPARLPGPWRQYPSSPEGWGVKMVSNNLVGIGSVDDNLWHNSIIMFMTNTSFLTFQMKEGKLFVWLPFELCETTHYRLVQWLVKAWTKTKKLIHFAGTVRRN